MPHAADKNRFRRLVLATLCLGGMVSDAPARQNERGVGVASQSQPADASRVYHHRHALCIGINDYAAPSIPDLSYAEADAREVADVLRNLYGYENVRLLLGTQSTRKRINDGLAELFDPKRVGRDDAVVVYFSGHGQTVREGQKETGYLIPQDAQIDFNDLSNPAPYRRDALRMDDLRTDADGIPARHVLFLVDACYSGFLSSKSLDDVPALANALKYPARQVITAGAAGEQSVEHNAWGHGAFTYKLLEILRTEQQPLQASRLGVMLKERVPREVASRFGKSRSLSPQAKYLSGDGDFLFIRPGTVLGMDRNEDRPILAPPDPMAALRRGDQRRISELIEQGRFGEAQSALAAYEKAHGADVFVSALKAELEKRAQAPLPKEFTNSIGARMVLIAADAPVTFQMGGELSPEEVVRRFGGEAAFFESEHPRHPVTINRPFYLAAHETTVGQFRQFVNATGYVTDAEKGGQAWENGRRGGYTLQDDGSWGWREDVNWRNPGFPQTDAHPVVLVSWNDARAFCDWLGRKENRAYRLPSEAEWEYACRGGTQSVFWWGDEMDTTGRVANVADQKHFGEKSPWKTMPCDDGHKTTAPVGSYRANGFGLHDMIGNVWEWCEDVWHDSYAGAPTDGSAWTSGADQDRRVLRGGGWSIYPGYCRSALRRRDWADNRVNNVGLRVVVVASGTP